MERRLLAILSYGHLATDLAQGAIPALLPVFKAHFHLSYAGVGFVVLVANISSSVVQPAFGALGDRLPLRWLMPLGALLSGVGMFFAVLTPSYALMLAMVFLSGLGVAAFHPEGYRFAGLVSGARRATGMSYFSVGGNLGYGLGPAAAGLALSVAGVYGMTYLLLFSIPAAILLWRAAGADPSERLRPTWTRPAAPSGNAVTMTSLTATASMAILVLLVAFVVLRSWVQVGVASFIPLYFTEREHADPRFGALLVSVFLGAGAVGTLLGGLVADQWGRRLMLIVSMTILPPTLWLLPRTTGLSAMSLALISGMATVSTFTVVMVMAQDLIPERIGMISGLIIGFAVGMGGIGVALLGMVADRWGLLRAMDVTALLPILGLVIALLVPPDRTGGNLSGTRARTSMSIADTRV